MVFSTLAGMSHECGPSNGLNNLMKQFGKDRSSQQVKLLKEGIYTSGLILMSFSRTVLAQPKVQK